MRAPQLASRLAIAKHIFVALNRKKDHYEIANIQNSLNLKFLIYDFSFSCTQVHYKMVQHPRKKDICAKNYGFIFCGLEVQSSGGTLLVGEATWFLIVDVENQH